MTENRRHPVKTGPADWGETHEGRISRLEKKVTQLETAIVTLRQEVTRTIVMIANAETDVAVLQRRISDGETPKRHIIRDIGD